MDVHAPRHRSRLQRHRRRGHPRPQSSGGGASGRGPVDDDGGGRRPERPSDDSRQLLIALGLLVIGAGVMSARLLATASRRRTGAFRR